MSKVYQAFHEVCNAARDSEEERVFVSLYREVKRYGGPEEGGWWYTNRYLACHQEFRDRRLAEQAFDQVCKLAAELTLECRRDWSRRCQRQIETAEARGMDVDEMYGSGAPDEEGYSVAIETELGADENDERPHYE